MVDDRTKGLDFQVRQSDLREHRFVPMGEAELSLLPGQALLRVDKFAFTANNITYAVVGDMMYWKFFPAPPGWGHIPVWGFADVIASRSQDAVEGTRVYGYLPLSTHLVAQPRAGAEGWSDICAHRATLPFIYNSYTTVHAGTPAREEDLAALFRPLFTTSFVLDHFIAANDGFGADTIIVGSASSKTAFGMAWLLAQRDGVRVVGLTSEANRAFTQGLGCYDQVLSYDQLHELPSDRPAVYVDMSGNSEVRSKLHHHLGERMVQSVQVGMTHWEQREGNAAQPGPLPGAQPSFFFAPTYVAALIKEHGPGGFQALLSGALESVAQSLGEAIELVHGRGPQEVARVYAQTLEGQASPQRGHILSLFETR